MAWIVQQRKTIQRKVVFGKTPMQTFSDSKELAKAKYVTNLFGQNTNFKMLDEAQAGSTGKQPARNSLTDGNNKAVEQDITAFTDQLFLSQMP